MQLSYISAFLPYIAGILPIYLAANACMTHWTNVLIPAPWMPDIPCVHTNIFILYIHHTLAYRNVCACEYISGAVRYYHSILSKSIATIWVISSVCMLNIPRWHKVYSCVYSTHKYRIMCLWMCLNIYQVRRGYHIINKSGAAMPFISRGHKKSSFLGQFFFGWCGFVSISFCMLSLLDGLPLSLSVSLALSLVPFLSCHTYTSRQAQTHTQEHVCSLRSLFLILLPWLPPPSLLHSFSVRHSLFQFYLTHAFLVSANFEYGLPYYMCKHIYICIYISIYIHECREARKYMCVHVFVCVCARSSPSTYVYVGVSPHLSIPHFPCNRLDANAEPRDKIISTHSGISHIDNSTQVLYVYVNRCLRGLSTSDFSPFYFILR